MSRTKINWGSGNGKGSVIFCMGNDDRQHQTQEYVGGVGEFEKTYCILRGINISGKNKVPMAELKQGFEKLDLGEVKTYLNSGNVIFSSDEDGAEKFTNQIEVMIKNGLAWIFLFLSYQKKNLKTSCIMRQNGGAMEIMKFMTILYLLCRRPDPQRYIVRLESLKRI